MSGPSFYRQLLAVTHIHYSLCYNTGLHEKRIIKHFTVPSHYISIQIFSDIQSVGNPPGGPQDNLAGQSLQICCSIEGCENHIFTLE